MGRPRKKEKGVFGPRKLADGTKAWDVRYRNEKGENKSVTVYDLEEANAIARDHREGRYNERLAPTTELGEFFAREEVKSSLAREHGLSTGTMERWMSIWRNHLSHPDYGIGDLPVSKFSKKGPVNQMLNGMDEAGVGKPTQRRSLGILSAILDEAVEEDLVPYNVVRVMKNKPSADRERELYIPTIEVVEMIRLDLLTCHYRARRREYRQRDALMISILAYDALRPEEFRQLPWERSGKDSLEMHVIAQKAKRGKSKTLHRFPPVQEVIAAELQAWYQRLGEPEVHTPVLPLSNWGGRQGGGPWDEKSWADWRARIFKPALARVAEQVGKNEEEKEAITAMRPYDLRHTGISQWLANGGKDKHGDWDGSPANPVDVAAWAGHEMRTMWETYAHVVKNASGIPIQQQILDAREKLGLDPVTGLAFVGPEPGAAPSFTAAQPVAA